MSSQNKFPVSKQTEFSVTAMMIRHPANIELAITYGLDVDCFYQEPTRNIFMAISRLYKRKAYIDQITIMDELTAMGVQITMEQLKELIDKKVEHSDALIGHIELLQELKAQRKIIEKIKTFEEISLMDNKTADEKLELISNETASIVSKKEDLRTYNEKLGYSKVLDKIKETIKNKGKSVVRFGFEVVDKVISLLPGVHIVSAPPGGGKTAFVMQVVENNAYDNKRVLFFSLEMNYEQLMMRKIQSKTGIPSWKMHSGSLSNDELSQIADVEENLSENIIYNDTSNIDIAKLKSVAKIEHNKKKLDLIAVDYIQLIRVAGKKFNREDEEIKFISAELLGLAKDLGVPILALAQMNRDFHKNEGKRPTMANLHGGSSLEKDALSIMFLHREGQFDPSCPNPNAVDVIVGKNRFGNSTTAKMIWDGARCMFRERTQQDVVEEVEFEAEKKAKNKSKKAF